MERPPRTRKHRIDGEIVKRTYTIRAEIDAALAEEARRDFRNNKSLALETALIEWLNRRNDVRAA
jgi:hypothetical protein